MLNKVLHAFLLVALSISYGYSASVIFCLETPEMGTCHNNSMIGNYTSTWSSSTDYIAARYYNFERLNSVDIRVCVGFGIPQPPVFRCFFRFLERQLGVRRTILSWGKWPKSVLPNVAGAIDKLLKKMNHLERRPYLEQYSMLTSGYLRRGERELSVDIPTHLKNYISNYVVQKNETARHTERHLESYRTYLKRLERNGVTEKDYNNLAICFQSSLEKNERHTRKHTYRKIEIEAGFKTFESFCIATPNNQCTRYGSWNQDIDVISDLYWLAVYRYGQNSSVGLCYGAATTSNHECQRACVTRVEECSFAMQKWFERILGEPSKVVVKLMKRLQNK
eukprot:252056_1